MATADRRPLDRPSVLRAAIAVIDQDGPGACTMRAVAARLGVEPMSLYWHVANKDDLLDGVVVTFLEGVATPAAGAGDWRDRVRAFAASFRGLVLDHPNVALLVAQRPATGYVAAKRAAAVLLRDLERAGFAPARAIDVARMVARFVLGVSMAEAATSVAPSPRPAGGAGEIDGLLAAVAADDAGRLFDLCVETMLAGIEAAVPRA